MNLTLDAAREIVDELAEVCSAPGRSVTACIPDIVAILVRRELMTPELSFLAGGLWAELHRRHWGIERTGQ